MKKRFFLFLKMGLSQEISEERAWGKFEKSKKCIKKISAKRIKASLALLRTYMRSAIKLIT